MGVPRTKKSPHSDPFRGSEGQVKERLEEHRYIAVYRSLTDTSSASMECIRHQRETNSLGILV